MALGRSLLIVAGVSLLLAPSALRAQLEVPRDHFEFDADLTGQGVKMNYGPFLAYSLVSADRDAPKSKKDPGTLHRGLITEGEPPIALRAINVYLGGKYAAAFDTEFCSYAAAWSGGFLNLRGTNLNGYKGIDLAYLRRPVLFQNTPTPGWSLDGRWTDPRPGKYGALPKQIAHYKGLYLHGWRTILSYTVGDTNVLELPAVLVKDRADVFCRTIHIDRADAARSLFVCDLAGSTGSLEGEAVARLQRADATLRVGIANAPSGARLQIADGTRVVVHLPPHTSPIAFKVFVANAATGSALTQIMSEAAKVEDLPALMHGGPARWKEEIVTRATLGKDDGAYTVDKIVLPDDNPWRSWMRPGAFDFFPDGRAALCTWNGDVWIVSGLGGDLAKVTWKRFATGLFEPLGLKIVDGALFVLSRDQITRLHDLNGDGEADFYENFNNDGPTAPSFHSFAIELHTDRAGNFYYLRGAHRAQPGTPMHGGLIKVAKDGSGAELICTGLREPNGMAIGPGDLITVADNQGNWVPSSKIDIIKKGGFYGYVWDKESKDRRLPEQPLCWIPMKEDNSSGSQVWVGSDRWGPFKGRLLHTSYGTCKLFLVTMQRDGDRYQGGVVPFPLEFDSGVMRAQFNPKDGQLYVAGLKGWGTSAKADGGFYRVRYTGKPVYLPNDLHVSKGKLAITFAVPLDKTALSPANVRIEQWNYKWSEKYGSPDYSIASPGKMSRDPVEVKAVSLAADGRMLILDVPHLQPVMQMGIYLNGLRAADGHPIAADVYNTINYVP